MAALSKMFLERSNNTISPVGNNSSKTGERQDFILNKAGMHFQRKGEDCLLDRWRRATKCGRAAAMTAIM